MVKRYLFPLVVLALVFARLLVPEESSSKPPSLSDATFYHGVDEVKLRDLGMDGFIILYLDHSIDYCSSCFRTSAGLKRLQAAYGVTVMTVSAQTETPQHSHFQTLQESFGVPGDYYHDKHNFLKKTLKLSSGHRYIFIDKNFNLYAILPSEHPGEQKEFNKYVQSILKAM